MRFGDRVHGRLWYFYDLFNKVVIGGNLAFAMGCRRNNQSDSTMEFSIWTRVHARVQAWVQARDWASIQARV